MTLAPFLNVPFDSAATHQPRRRDRRAGWQVAGCNCYAKGIDVGRGGIAREFGRFLGYERSAICRKRHATGMESASLLRELPRALGYNLHFSTHQRPPQALAEYN